MLHDEWLGVDEALNETAYGKGLVARGKHYLLFGPKTTQGQNMVTQERFVQLKKLLPCGIFVSNSSELTFKIWQKFNHMVIYRSPSIIEGK